MQPAEVCVSIHHSVSASIYGSESAKKAKMRKYKINTVIPDWHSMSPFESYGQKIPAVGVKSLQNLQAGQSLEQPSIPITFKCVPYLFAEGTESLVYHGFDFTSRRAVVLKKFKCEGKEFNSLDCYMREVEVRTVCSNQLNDEKCKPPGSVAVEVTPVDVVSCAGQDHYLLEAFLG